MLKLSGSMDFGGGGEGGGATTAETFTELDCFFFFFWRVGLAFLLIVRAGQGLHSRGWGRGGGVGREMTLCSST